MQDLISWTLGDSTFCWAILSLDSVVCSSAESSASFAFTLPSLRSSS